jgi:hypothetical protein
MSFLSATGGSVDASGGSTVTTFTDNGGTQYRIHAFENVGTDTFTVNRGGEVDVLVVGGGGSGGSTGGGGGGAGGVVFKESLSVSDQSYSITVGDGAPPATGWSAGTGGQNGDNSTAFGFTALGGGGGADHPSYNKTNGSTGAGNGGSGGGGRETGGAAGTQPGTNPNATLDLGNDGGDGNGSNGYGQGGGGGAGSSGQNGNNSVAGDGGIGEDFSAEFGTVFGENGYFGGGGASGYYIDNGVSDGAGGLGGGGDGGNRTQRNADNGLPNTGGGGGGGGYDGENNNAINSGLGGSGIVLVRYEA